MKIAEIFLFFWVLSNLITRAGSFASQLTLATVIQEMGPLHFLDHRSPPELTDSHLRSQSVGYTWVIPTTPAGIIALCIMDHNSSPRLSASNSYDYRYEDWIDTAAIPNGPFVSADATPGYNMNVDFGRQLREGLDDTSIYLNSPESRGTESSIAESEEIPGILAIESLTISTAFQESPNDPNWPTPDIILTSSDSDEVRLTSEDKIERVRYLPEIHSSELNDMLHIVNHASCARFSPSLQVIIGAIDHLPKYGIARNIWVTKTNPIYNLILQAPMYPLDLYCLCERRGICDLSTAVSVHLLSFNLGSLTDEDAEKMGSLYLARLFRLHRSRVKALMDSLMPAPDLHDSTRDCNFESQKTLLSAWTMAVTYLSQCAKPDITMSDIRSVLDSTTTHITCKDCLKGRDDRVNKIVLNWTLVKESSPSSVSFLLKL
ncbi:hypothetical protein D9758_006145 [Tetrapyrgos nigripes]|uniref:Uncharacterized protein n=1 Tax=Tetrapyrgos nigripes TaxID=182062 RepID=A0A8H5LLC3_9AGAR|nr:hypothetical protein D9758_006145 [Tetrapyrgos nigripes]